MVACLPVPSVERLGMRRPPPSLLALLLAAGCSDSAKEASPSADPPATIAALPRGRPVFFRIVKEPAELEAFLEESPGGPFAFAGRWPICKWSGSLGPKLREGDRQSPEGFYFVTRSRMNPNSRYHLAFDVGFPNEFDRHHGRTGSFIMVHGGCASVGCFAMTDPGIEAIYGLADAALDAGQPFFRVHVFPFPMTTENLDRHRDSPWIGFWENLAEGWRHFEERRRPPDVQVRDGRYVFGPS